MMTKLVRVSVSLLALAALFVIMSRGAVASDPLNGLFLMKLPSGQGIVYYSITTRRSGNLGKIVGSFTSVSDLLHKRKLVLQSDVSGTIDFADNTVVIQLSNIHDPNLGTSMEAAAQEKPLVVQADLSDDGFVVRGQAPDGTLHRVEYHKVTEAEVNRAIAEVKI